MKKLFAAAVAAVAAVLVPLDAQASSHREAPFITRSPKVDGTDFYLFNSYQTGRGNFVTLIANYQPLQDAYGGPNYFTMDPEALYEIHVDNTGDAVEDITFQFRFNNALANNNMGIALPIARPDGGDAQMVAIPLTNAGPIGMSDGGFTAPGALQNVIETYSVNVVRGGRRTGAPQAVTNTQGNGATFTKPFDNVGSKTFPGNSYSAYARSFIYSVNVPGCTVPARLFVGQRAEGFAVNLGTIFDLVNAPAGVITDPALRGAVMNPIADKNVTTLALEVDKSCLTSTTGGDVIGGWTTASVRQARVINPAGRYVQPAREGGAWAQVSRLGMPLVNEVVIGIPDKDRFNTSEPKDDLANFGKYITNPTLPKLINILFGVPEPIEIPRGDLVVAFATGVPGVNKFPGANSAVAEMQRLNTAIGATPAASQNDLGAAGCFVAPADGGTPELVVAGNSACDPAGFPNGRRPGDDVVDVALRVSMGYLLSPTVAGARAVPFHDAVLQNASQFDTEFPYLKTPNPGTP